MAMFENISEFFKRFKQNDKKELLAENPPSQSKDTAKDRLHVVLMQDRANVSADFLEMMKEEIIEVIKKYIVVDETKIDVRLTNEENEDGSIGAPLLHANIPILNVRNDLKGTYMNESSSEKIEGQQEIFVEENNNIEQEIEEEKNEALENIPELEEIEEAIEVENIENSNVDEKELVTEEVVEAEKETDTEVEGEIEFEAETEKETKVEMQEQAKTIEPLEENIPTNDIEEDDEDDDVTFDDLLKAAEEEEERLKQKEEIKDNEEKKKAKKTNSKKKKKTSKR